MQTQVFNNQEKNIYNEKVVAITVTYNRTYTLKRTIEALTNQTKPVYKIIIVDNNSSREEKEKIKEIALQNLNVDVLWLTENIGGAGGFEAGMNKALEEYQPDWYWIMDDDAYPRQDCLEVLLSYKHSLENVGCITPVIYGIDNNDYQMYHHKKITKYTMKDRSIETIYSDLQEITQIDANAFVGPLFSKCAVEDLGVADGELFIYGDDTEYTYRISKKYNIYLVKNAIIDHQDPPKLKKVDSSLAWWKEYYEIRNRFLFINKFEKKFLKRILPKLYLVCKVLKKILVSIINKNFKGYKKFRIRLLLQAWIDGINGKKGKVIDPIEYFKVINKIKNEG